MEKELVFAKPNNTVQLLEKDVEKVELKMEEMSASSRTAGIVICSILLIIDIAVFVWIHWQRVKDFERKTMPAKMKLAEFAAKQAVQGSDANWSDMIQKPNTNNIESSFTDVAMLRDFEDDERERRARKRSERKRYRVYSGNVNANATSFLFAPFSGRSLMSLTEPNNSRYMHYPTESVQSFSHRVYPQKTQPNPKPIPPRPNSSRGLGVSGFLSDHAKIRRTSKSPYTKPHKAHENLLKILENRPSYTCSLDDMDGIYHKSEPKHSRTHSRSLTPAREPRRLNCIVETQANMLPATNAKQAVRGSNTIPKNATRFRDATTSPLYPIEIQDKPTESETPSLNPPVQSVHHEQNISQNHNCVSEISQDISSSARFKSDSTVFHCSSEIPDNISSSNTSPDKPQKLMSPESPPIMLQRSQDSRDLNRSQTQNSTSRNFNKTADCLQMLGIERRTKTPQESCTSAHSFTRDPQDSGSPSKNSKVNRTLGSLEIRSYPLTPYCGNQDNVSKGSRQTHSGYQESSTLDGRKSRGAFQGHPGYQQNAFLDPRYHDSADLDVRKFRGPMQNVGYQKNPSLDCIPKAATSAQSFENSPLKGLSVANSAFSLVLPARPPSFNRRRHVDVPQTDSDNSDSEWKGDLLGRKVWHFLLKMVIVLKYWHWSQRRSFNRWRYRRPSCNPCHLSHFTRINGW